MSNKQHYIHHFKRAFCLTSLNSYSARVKLHYLRWEALSCAKCRSHPCCHSAKVGWYVQMHDTAESSLVWRAVPRKMPWRTRCYSLEDVLKRHLKVTPISVDKWDRLALHLCAKHRQIPQKYLRLLFRENFYPPKIMRSLLNIH